MFGLLVAMIELGVLIIIHEGGHYLVARLSGMRVDRFSIGFGPPIVHFTRGETTYQIGLIPLGGFVQIAGLNPNEEGLAVDDPRAYPNRPVWQRVATIFAGPGTNYIFAALLMAFICATFGVPVEGKMPVVGQLVKNAPAAAAGVKLADEIVSVDGKPVKDLGDVSSLIEAGKGKPIDIVVLREGERQSVTVTPAHDGDHYRIGIGIEPNEVRERQPLGAAITFGLTYPYHYTRFMLHALGQMVTGKREREFSGPLGIITQMKKQVKSGLVKTIESMAIISICLGLFNLLPLPALDGGRLAFLVAEGLSRRRVNQRFEQTVHLVGICVLMAFVLYVTVRYDVPRLFK